MNKYFAFLLICVGLLFSCSDSDTNLEATLASYLDNQAIELGGVIACAASDVETNAILTFYYPEEGATNIQYYETSSTDTDENNFSNYLEIDLEPEPFFNGYLGKFMQNSPHEKWIIVTFKLGDVIKVSNPIRSKQISKPTVWNNDVTINQAIDGMPNFFWPDNAAGDNTIYFQVISDTQNNLLSGTYTYDNNFKYYDTSNVVLNITTQNPPSLIEGNFYNFTLMDVSEDNWVNLVILKSFTAV